MNSNGVITAPVSIHADVYPVLGIGAQGGFYDTVTACKSDRVNKNSLYKPINVNTMRELSDQEWFNNNFGYTIPTFNSYTAMTRGVSAGNALWTYVKPQSYCRLTDFVRYDHRATSPFLLSIDSNSKPIGGTMRVTFPTDVSWLTKWGMWQAFQGTQMQYLNCGFYVPGAGYFPLTDTNQGLQLSDLEMGKLSFTIDSSNFSVGSTYSVYLVLTTWDSSLGPRKWVFPSESEGGSWWIIAMEQQPTFTVTAASESSPLTAITVTGSGTGNYTMSQNGDIVWSNVVLNISVKATDKYTYSNGTLTIDVVVMSYPGYGTQLQEKKILSLTIPGISKGFSQSYTRSAEGFTKLSGKDDYTDATMRLTLSVQNNIYTSQSDITISGTEV